MHSGERPRFRVVHADDEASIRHIVRDLLEASGWFEVVGQAADGESAIALAEALHPDLVLLDLEMPVLGGLDALPRLRRSAPGARVLVLSAREADDVSPVVKARGAVGFLHKGVHLEGLADDVLAAAGLLEAVGTVLGEAHQRVTDDLAAPGTARGFVAATLERWRCADLLDTVSLLVSELVTNAVVHAHCAPDVSVVLLPTAIHIEVADDDPRLPVPGNPAPDATSGRGIALVDTYANRWGVDPRPDGKSVWFELDRPSAA